MTAALRNQIPALVDAVAREELLVRIDVTTLREWGGGHKGRRAVDRVYGEVQIVPLRWFELAADAAVREALHEVMRPEVYLAARLRSGPTPPNRSKRGQLALDLYPAISL